MSNADQPTQSISSLTESKLSADEFREDFVYIEKALSLVMENHMNEAKKTLVDRRKHHLFSCMGYSILCSVEALLVFNQEKIETALSECHKSVYLSSKNRRKGSLIETLFMVDVSVKYTVDELLAEVIYASSLLFQAIIGFISDDKLANFIKSAYNINKAYRIFKYLYYVMINPTKQNSQHEFWNIFCTGVYHGYGMFNIIISLMPSKIASYLSFIGFVGELNTGMDCLYIAFTTNTFFNVIAGISYSVFHYTFAHTLGLSGLNMEKASSIVENLSIRFPNGLLIKYLQARKQLMTGNLSECIRINNEIINTKIEWDQFIHVCYWELMWCHSLKCDWDAALTYAKMLSEKSKWSRVTCSYFQVALLLTKENSCSSHSEDVSKNIFKIIENISDNKHNFSGKTIPIEQFCLARCDTYNKTKYLSIPFIEVLYIYGWFEYIHKNLEFYTQIFEVIKNEYLHQKSNFGLSDNYFICTLLLASCYRINKEYKLAISLLEHIISNKISVTLSKYICPFACLELAKIYQEEKNPEKFKYYIELSKKIFTNYILEFKLLFKIKSLCIDNNIE